MFVPTQYEKSFVTKSDLLSRQDWRSDKWLEPPLHNDEPVLRGNIDFLHLQEGLSVHYSNAEDLHDLEIESECGPRLCVSLFLEGHVNAAIGDLRIPMPLFREDGACWQPVATIFAQARAERFMRRSNKGMRLRKVIISIAPQWLDRLPGKNTPDRAAIGKFAACHLACHSWVPSPHAVSLAEQIINAPQALPCLHTLYVQSRVLGLIEDSFRQICGGGGESDPHATLRPVDRKRLQAINHHLDQHAGHSVAIDSVCREIGLSENSLRRLISNAYGMPVSRYIRRYMLERARHALERDNASIAEAAFIAGYNSPANFATAFKRIFGLSPSNVQDR